MKTRREAKLLSQNRYIVRYLNEGEYEQWDNFVDNSPQGTLFHKSYWLKASGQKFRIYGCFKNENLVGGLPIICKSKFGIKQAIHPPLTPYLGIVFKKNETKYVNKISEEKKISECIAKKVKKDFYFIRFNFSPFFTDLQPFIWQGFSINIRYTYLLNLKDLEEIWRNIEDSRRNDIRRAEKDGLTVKYNNDFQKTFALVEKTFYRQNLKPKFKPVAFEYNRILSEKNQCKSFLTRNREGKTIAAVYIVWDKKRSYYLLGGYDPGKKHHGASAIAMWEAIKFTKEKLGLNEFDFEGSMIRPVEQFFRKFGGKITPYYSVTWAKSSIKIALFMREITKEIIDKSKLG